MLLEQDEMKCWSWWLREEARWHEHLSFLTWSLCSCSMSRKALPINRLSKISIPLGWKPELQEFFRPETCIIRYQLSTNNAHPHRSSLNVAEKEWLSRNVQWFGGRSKASYSCDESVLYISVLEEFKQGWRSWSEASFSIWWIHLVCFHDRFSSLSTFIVRAVQEKANPRQQREQGKKVKNDECFPNDRICLFVYLLVHTLTGPRMGGDLQWESGFPIHQYTTMTMPWSLPVPQLL